MVRQSKVEFKHLTKINLQHHYLCDEKWEPGGIFDLSMSMATTLMSITQQACNSKKFRYEQKIMRQRKLGQFTQFFQSSQAGQKSNRKKFRKDCGICPYHF